MIWNFNNEYRYESDDINKDLAVSPWGVNRDFAYDLVANLKPRSIVELGTFYGCSLFAMLQAIKDFNMDSKFMAIDCWEGDEHAGFYGNEVMDSVSTILANKYQQVSELVTLEKCYFEDALDKIANHSINLLHIDGYHTYEATKNNFEIYFDKLADEAIVLFHDISSTTGYTSTDYWLEISAKYPGFALEFSWGLGVLFPKGIPTLFKELFANEDELKHLLSYYKNKALKDLYEIQNADIEKMLEERGLIMDEMNLMISNRDEAISNMEQMIIERDSIISKNDNYIADLKEAILNNEKMIQERDELILKYENILNAISKKQGD